jgi:hypothetical protein
MNMSAKHKADVKHDYVTQDTINDDVIADNVLGGKYVTGESEWRPTE